jgi:cobalt-zinc-cadmium efflux system outer membrane protein
MCQLRLSRPALTALIVCAWFVAAAESAHGDEAGRSQLAAEDQSAPGVIPQDVTGVSLDDLVELALEQNPRLSKASYTVLVARGRATQAGLYPNPTVGITFDELLDKTGRGGVNTLPLVSQEIVTAGKLRLSQEAGLREVDQATWQVVGQRYELFGRVRTSFFDALALQTRIDILERMVKLAEQSAGQSNELLQAKQVARLDVVQLEVEVERLRAELEASQRELPGAYKRVAAIVGMNHLAIGTVVGQIEQPLPEYDLEAVQAFVLNSHPDVQAARFGVERARVLITRAKVEPIPNITLDTGYVRQNQNRSDDFRIGANLTIPLWNKNQGNIRAAEAHYCEAAQQVRQVENELTEQLAVAMRDYAAARRRAERYRTAILPRAKETYTLSRQAYQGGQFEYLRVLESQRAFAQAYLEYIRALGEAWKAAAAISGLALEDEWPLVPQTVPPAPENDPSN